MNNIEINGAANIIMILECLVSKGKVKECDAAPLTEEALRLIVYLKQLDNPKAVAWHSIKAPQGK